MAAREYNLQHEADGRAFYWVNGVVGGSKNYVSPVAMGTGERPEDTTSIFHAKPQWDAQKGEWVTPFDWGNVATLATAGVLGAGIGDLAFGGAGAAGAGGSAASTAGPTAATTSLTGGTTASVGSLLTKSLLNYGIPLAGGIINGVIQSKAISSAQKAEQEALDKALAAERERDAYTRAHDAEQSMYDRARYDEATNYDRNRYASYIKTLEPYRQTGTAANDRMGQILGLNFTPNSGTTYPQLADVADTPVNLSQQFRPLSTGLQGQLVTMVAPNGETSQVPNELVDHYMQLGARRA